MNHQHQHQHQHHNRPSAVEEYFAQNPQSIPPPPTTAAPTLPHSIPYTPAPGHPPWTSSPTPPPPPPPPPHPHPHPHLQHASVRFEDSAAGGPPRPILKHPTQYESAPPATPPISIPLRPAAGRQASPRLPGYPDDKPAGQAYLYPPMSAGPARPASQPHGYSAPPPYQASPDVLPTPRHHRTHSDASHDMPRMNPAVYAPTASMPGYPPPTSAGPLLAPGYQPGVPSYYTGSLPPTSHPQSSLPPHNPATDIYRPPFNQRYSPPGRHASNALQSDEIATSASPSSTDDEGPYARRPRPDARRHRRDRYQDDHYGSSRFESSDGRRRFRSNSEPPVPPAVHQIRHPLPMREDSYTSSRDEASDAVYDSNYDAERRHPRKHRHRGHRAEERLLDARYGRNTYAYHGGGGGGSSSSGAGKGKAHKKGGRDTFLGTVGGAVIGDAIFPGLGTVGGALLGGWGGHKIGDKGARGRNGRRGDGRRATREADEEAIDDDDGYTADTPGGRRHVGHRAHDSYTRGTGRVQGVGSGGAGANGSFQAYGYRDGGGSDLDEERSSDGARRKRGKVINDRYQREWEAGRRRRMEMGLGESASMR